MGAGLSYDKDVNSGDTKKTRRTDDGSGDDANTNANAFVIADFPLKRSSSEVFVEDTLLENPVVIFSKSTCGFCTKAKSIFDSLGVRYRTVEIDKRPDCAELQNHLKLMTGARTVPRVFVGGQCIGGGDDTVTMFEQGRLQKLLKEKNIHCPNCAQ